MNGKTFVDTNIMVYAYDLDAGSKRDVASKSIKDLWQNQKGVISTQVLQEFYVNVTQKISDPLSGADARTVLKDYLHWQIELNGPETIFSASEIQEQYRLSFWDALIIASAIQGRAVKILTEDLNHGQVIEGILIENPLRSSEPSGE